MKNTFLRLDKLLTAMLITVERYPQPIKALVRIISGITNGVLIGMYLIAFLSTFIIYAIMDVLARIETSIVNILSHHRYEREVDQLKMESNLTADDVKKISGFTKISLIFKSIIHAIAQPLPQSTFNKMIAILIVKPLQVFLAPVILITAITIELVRFASMAALFSVIAVLMLVKVASLAVLNLPLYTIDALKRLNSWFKPSESKSPLEKPEKDTASYIQQRLEYTTPTPSNDEKKEDLPVPGHFSSPIARKPQIKTASKNDINEEFNVTPSAVAF